MHRTAEVIKELSSHREYNENGCDYVLQICLEERRKSVIYELSVEETICFIQGMKITYSTFFKS